LDFSDSSAALGEVLLKQGHLDAALVHFREALNIAASASVADPNDQRAQEDLADACRGLANSLAQQRQASEALQYAQRALEVTAKMAATNASSPASQNEVAQAYGTLGSVYNARAMGQTRNQAKSRTDIESALAYFQKAQAIYDDLTHRGPVPLATTVESQRILQEVSHSQQWLETAHAVGSNKTKT
jgi:tetratricopeptide (TPR) repeat protein